MQTHLALILLHLLVRIGVVDRPADTLYSCTCVYDESLALIDVPRIQTEPVHILFYNAASNTHSASAQSKTICERPIAA